ncbi:hypothetical protein L6164_035936 [Bauhinia variegata]|uniref:Uncharacterized protein n=1 Tax=Bauhinia variegata TaxID=167791 RepID=A0ACB9KFH4_BAUVA|nr:hypothetical protein L6164_035936 [Bauhinia variegata]
MKTFKTLFLFAMLMALVITLSSATSSEEEELPNTNENEEPTSLRGTSRFLAQKKARSALTCDKYPKLCHVKGSAGPDCCNNKCVNLSTDRFNCGKCGKKCGYSKICCDGKCVNPMTNEKHCGKCGNKCDKASSCLYGMCSYE